MTLAVVTAAVALASGCAHAVSAHPPAAAKKPAPATASFSAMGVAFRYPVSWRSGTWSADVSSFSALIVYLSTSRLRLLCTVRTSPGQIAETCEWCLRLGGAETITVVILRAAPGNWYQMDACLRGPALAHQEAEISSLLKSVHISSGY